MLKSVSVGLRRGLCAAWLGLVLACGVATASAETDPKYYAVEVSAAVNVVPAQVQLNWTPDANATGYYIERKAPGASTWTATGSVGGTVNTYTDTAVTAGASFEYHVRKTTTLGYVGHGYVLAGINAPLVENRGKLILVVDNTYGSALAAELTRLQQDLVGDGWVVVRKDVAPTASAPTVKALIKGEYTLDPANVKAVFLFGHVAVPRSGNINPDGHPDHQGAWAADSYYADMDGVWTDSTANNTAAALADNWNVPGDGKFDQDTIPSDLELAVGRVDLSNMTCFSNKTPTRSELDLLRQYLNKDHNFRMGLLNLPRRGLVCDNFGEKSGEAFAAAGWRSFAAMFGGGTTYKADYGTYFPTLATQGYLWSYGTGGGSYYTCDGVGGSDDFALNDVQTTFMMLFGSYFGDWDNESNFLRAALGSTSHTLTVSWAGRPLWFYHRMALGETIGASTLLSQNNKSGGTYEPQNYGTRGVHTALLGDPTLRMHPVAPMSNLTGVTNSTGLTLSWGASSDTNIQGFHVYRSTNANGPFTRLTTNALITGTSFVDAAPLTNGVYMVRAVKLEVSGSGTYFNPSQGVFYTNGVATVISPTPAPTPSPTPTPTVTNSASATFVKSDATTKGSWKGVYGTDGNWVESANAALPTYATTSVAAANTWTWNYDVTDTRATVLPGATTTRVAACWYSTAPFTFSIGVKSGQTNRFSAYFLDWDSSGRQERVEILDATTGATLSSQTLTNFSGGVYLTWDIAGNVQMRVTRLVGVNGVVSALFFDPTAAAPTPAPAPTSPAPALPTNLAALATSATNVQLSWKDQSTNETGFAIYRRSGTSAAVAIGSVGANVTNAVDATVAGGATYYYSICALGSATNSALTAEVGVTTPAVIVAPSAPTNLTATLTNLSAAKVSWTDTSTNELGFRVYCKAGTNGTYMAIATNGANVATLQTTGLVAGAQYFYKVCAFNSAGDSAFSSEASVSVPAATTNLTASASFVGLDSTNGGNWKGIYGTYGNWIYSAPAQLPTFATVTPSGASGWTWNYGVTDAAALVLPGATTTRVAACWYSSSAFTFDIGTTDSQTHRVSAYFLDWDFAGRQERVDVIDSATGAVLDSRTISNFANGVYASWDFKGKIQLKITPLAGPNAVVSGLFF